MTSGAALLVTSPAIAAGNETVPESTALTLVATYLFGDDVATYVEIAENLVLGPYTFWVRAKEQVSVFDATFEILQLIDGDWVVVAETDDPYFLDPYAAGVDPWGGGRFVGNGASGTWVEGDNESSICPRHGTERGSCPVPGGTH